MLNFRKKITQEHPYEIFFFKDTVVAIRPFQKIVFIPETYRTHHISDGSDGSVSNYVFSRYTESYKDDKTLYKIEKIKDSTKKIMGKLCYKYNVTRKIKIGKRTNFREFDLCISDELYIPALNYPFLKLEKKIKLDGLILEAKFYRDRNDYGDGSLGEKSIELIYKAKSYNTKKQDRGIIDQIFNSVTEEFGN